MTALSGVNSTTATVASPLTRTVEFSASSMVPSSTSESSMSSDQVQVEAAVRRIRHESSSSPARLSKTPSSCSSSELDLKNASEFMKLVWRVGRIFQHFAIRTPHVACSMASVYLITRFYFNLPAFANDATAFVGTAGAVYCFLRPFFLTTIPYLVLKEDHKLWREAINCCNTVFITLTVTSAAWKLNIDPVQGIAIWALSFGGPYKLLSYKLYPQIDAEFKTENVVPSRRS